MIALAVGCQVFIHTGVTDFRKGIDGLTALCRKELGKEPLSGAVFAFSNRNRQSLKLLVYDGQGFWLCQKRLSRGKFHSWPKKTELLTQELLTLIWNGDFAKAEYQQNWI